MSRIARRHLPSTGMRPRRLLGPQPSDLVSIQPMDPNGPIRLGLVEPLREVDLGSWIRGSRDVVAEWLRTWGALLFRAFPVAGSAAFEEIAASLGEPLYEYSDQHTPRSLVAGNVYTSTEYPPAHRVPFHSENSKNRAWPRHLWFHCDAPAESGGATPLSWNSLALERLPAAMVDKARSLGFEYTRSFGTGVGVSWQKAYGCDDRDEVLEVCQLAGMEATWERGEVLRVVHRAQGTAVHPETADEVWFNQVELFHPSTLDPQVRAELASVFGDDGRSSVRFGDGSPVTDADARRIRVATAAVARFFPWRQGDVLVVDNMLVAHGRESYRGQRRVLVALAGRYP